MREGSLLDKLWEILSSIAGTKQLLLVLALCTGALVFDFQSITSLLEIEDAVERHRIWLVLAFLTSAALMVLVFLQLLWSNTKGLGRAFSDWTDARSFRTSDGCQVLLQLMDSRAPDPTLLLTEHPDVRLLRRKGLVRESIFESHKWSSMREGYSDFELTDKGSNVVKYCKSSALYDEPADNLIEYIKTTTCLEFKKNGFVKLTKDG